MIRVQILVLIKSSMKVDKNTNPPYYASGYFDTSDVQILMSSNLLGFSFSLGVILSSETVKGKGVCFLFFSYHYNKISQRKWDNPFQSDSL